MKKELQTIITRTKDNGSRGRLLCLKLGFMLITVLVALGAVHSRVSAAGGLKIYNYSTKKETIYTDKQIAVTLNGQAIGNKKAPGILVKGVALVPYDDIFKRSNIAAECVYDKNKGTITISKYGKTILMTIGSTKAKVNGAAATLPVAPVKVKYSDAALTKVLVPSRFVSETLGLNYTWNSSISTVAMVKNTLSLSYDSGKMFEYTGSLGMVTVDGKKINLGNMPSIITNNTAMLRAKSIFTNAAIGAAYSYNSSDKTVTLTKGDVVLVMTIGSKTAYLNGTAVRMDTAPMIVKNHDVNTSYVMVPGRFTATSLGYHYEWNSSTGTSIITTPKAGDPSGTDDSDAPELGDESVIIETGTILNQWIGDGLLYGKSSNVHELNSENTGMNYGTIYSAARDYNNIKLNSETFQFLSSGSFGRITSASDGNRLVLQAEQMTCSEMTYPMLGTYSKLVQTIGIHPDETGLSSVIELDLVSPDYSYELSLSEDKQQLYVTISYNALVSAVAGTNDAGDYLTLTGMDSLKVSARQEFGLIYVDLPCTANTLGEINTGITGSKYINTISTVAAGDMTQLILGVNEGFELYLSETENRYSLLLHVPGAEEEPTASEPELPDWDTDEYNIRIPKPEGLTRGMITDQDNYYSNNFVLRLGGDYMADLSSLDIINGTDTVKDILVSLNSMYETEIIFKTTKLQGYTYTVDEDYIYVKVGNPRDIYPNIVILDPGHGGHDSGAVHFSTREKDLNYKMLYTIGEKYFNQDPSRLKVYYTRTTDVFVELKDRAAFAGKYGADIFVSLHMNAFTTATPYGTEVYYSASNNTPNSAGLTSKRMAELFCGNLVRNLNMTDRGAQAKRYTVVHNNTVPAVLIELGFLSNKKDHAKLTDPVFQENAIQTIYNTILQIFEQYPTGR